MKQGLRAAALVLGAIVAGAVAPAYAANPPIAHHEAITEQFTPFRIWVLPGASSDGSARSGYYEYQDLMMPGQELTTVLEVVEMGPRIQAKTEAATKVPQVPQPATPYVPGVTAPNQPGQPQTPSSQPEPGTTWTQDQVPPRDPNVAP